MNRLDRLSAILIHLQSKKIVTANELAKRFEISVRTVYRDIRSLESAGIPIGSEPGVGYFLVEGYSLPPVAFTFEEAGALLLAGKLTDAFADEGTKKSFESALYKIKSILNKDKKAFVSEIENKIGVYDAKGPMVIENNYLKEIQTALFSKKILEIQYSSTSNKQTIKRKIEPVSLGFYENRWHLLAFCHLRNAYRVFRVDRIATLIVLDQSYRMTHPSVETIIREMYKSKDLIEVAIRFTKGKSYATFKQKCELGFQKEKDLGDRVEVVLLADSLSILAKWLSDCTNTIEILYPIELKTIVDQHNMAEFNCVSEK